MNNIEVEAIMAGQLAIKKWWLGWRRNPFLTLEPNLTIEQLAQSHRIMVAHWPRMTAYFWE